MCRVRFLVGALTLVVLNACGSSVDPDLAVTVKPRSINNVDGVATLSISATDSSGKAGTGTVRLSASAGTFATPESATLVAGAVDVPYSCPIATDPGCVAGAQKISLEWVVNSKLVEATASVTITAVDAGTVDAGTVDAGHDAGVVDAGSYSLVLTSTRTLVVMGIGETAPLVATLTHNGTAVPDASVAFSSTLGGFAVDGGTNPTFTSTTDATGVANATFVDTGTAGSAVITAASLGATATLPMSVLLVQSVTYSSTLCGGSPCTLMGVKGSGFNPSAQVKFHVADPANKGVPGVPVTFDIVNPPAGTTVSPTGVTDANGDVVATVSAGLSIGAFDVHIVVIPGVIETNSTTLGVVGAKPSNLGFTLKCNKVNVAAFAAVVPPLAIQTTCTVALVDRYGNPVGTGTTVYLLAESGSVPKSVDTVKYVPGGSNTAQGTASFVYDTTTVVPSTLDVLPLPADPTQFPYARDAEPSRTSGALTLNPRDSLVTIMAYVRGEEHFYDDNSNGLHDPGERFVDQGEPFVDENDDNVCGVGEVKNIDTNGDQIWNPPNGTWDGDTNIWAQTHVLLTGPTDPSAATLTPSSLWFVPRGGLVTLAINDADARLNRVESGSSLSCRHTQVPGPVKGSINIRINNTSLDGYGFQLDPRRLVSADGTKACDVTTPICGFKTLFGSWERGYIGTVEVIGAASTDTTSSETDTVTCETTVRGIVGGTTSTGTVQ